MNWLKVHAAKFNTKAIFFSASFLKLSAESPEKAVNRKLVSSCISPVSRGMPTFDVSTCAEEAALACQNSKGRVGVIVEHSERVDRLWDQVAAKGIERFRAIKLSCNQRQRLLRWREIGHLIADFDDADLAPLFQNDVVVLRRHFAAF